MSDLDSLFSDADADKGSQRLFQLLRDPEIIQIECNGHNRIFYVDNRGQKVAYTEQVFPSAQAYERWLDELLALTDVGYTSVTDARTSVIEGSFRADASDLHGSIHIATREITRAAPHLTVRKQPRDLVTLDDMLAQNMMSPDMRIFLQQAVQGRLNILISGGSGAGKTTLARALSQFIDPSNRVITVEEIDELHLADRLPNVVSLTTYRHRDDDGRIVRETSLADLVRESLRMRGDRVWVGETRGAEAYALVKACNSGHDGSITTMHADNGAQAIRQAVTYVMESGLAEDVAREQVARAFHLVVQISKVKMGRRVISEITELESVLEGKQQRHSVLYRYEPNSEAFQQMTRPTNHLLQALARYGVNYDGVPGRL